MGLLLVKMALQNNDFTRHSPSIVVISAFYAATAFLKHSKKLDQAETSKFCSEARKVIFMLLEEELKDQKTLFKTTAFQSHLERKLGSSSKEHGQRILQTYQK